MSKVTKEPRRCACGHEERRTAWHCACGRWKLSSMAACETCSGVAIVAEPRQLSNPRAKLTEDDVRWIRHAAANGWKKVQLAEMFGVQRRAIFLILAGKSWTKVA